MENFGATTYKFIPAKAFGAASGHQISPLTILSAENRTVAGIGIASLHRESIPSGRGEDIFQEKEARHRFERISAACGEVILARNGFPQPAEESSLPGTDFRSLRRSHPCPERISAACGRVILARNKLPQPAEALSTRVFT